MDTNKKKEIIKLFNEGNSLNSISIKTKTIFNSVLKVVYDLDKKKYSDHEKKALLKKINKTEKDIKKIRELYINGEMTYNELANKYKLNRESIMKIANGITYRFVDGDVIDYKTKKILTLKNGEYVKGTLKNG